jgi:hypothetical protein
MDAGTLTALLIGASSLIGWMVTQTQARSRAQRVELRARRARDLLRGRYINRLEQVLSDRDMPLPIKPEGLIEQDEAIEL